MIKEEERRGGRRTTRRYDVLHKYRRYMFADYVGSTVRNAYVFSLVSNKAQTHSGLQIIKVSPTFLACHSSNLIFSVSVSVFLFVVHYWKYYLLTYTVHLAASSTDKKLHPLENGGEGDEFTGVCYCRLLGSARTLACMCFD